MPVDALVLDEIARMLRLLVAREIRRRTDDDEPQVAGDRNGDHVAVDHLAEPHPRVVTLGDDVNRLVAHEQLEVDARIRVEEARQHRSAEEAPRRAGDVDAKRAPRLAAHLA
jgi:hypothetical protein